VFGKSELWVGVVSGASTSAHITTSAFSNANHPQTTTNQIMNFLLDGRPVTYSAKLQQHIRDGDRVVVAGKVSNGVLRGLAYRNLTNGAREDAPATLMLGLGGALLATLLLGPIMLLFGVFTVPFGLFFLFLGLGFRKANQLVQTAPSGG